MTDKLTAIASNQTETCRQMFVRANMPHWAVEKCLVTCQEFIRQVCQAWQSKDSEAYEKHLNDLTLYVGFASKLSWHSVPPPITRLPDESIEDWITRTYQLWQGEEEYVGF